jgi:hypothetical protein
VHLIHVCVESLGERRADCTKRTFV